MKKFLLQQALEHSKRTLFSIVIFTMIIGSGIRFIILDDDVMNLLPKDMDSIRIWDEITNEFKYSDFLFVTFGNKNTDVLNSDILSLIWDLSENFNKISQVEEVLSLSTMNRMDNNDGLLQINQIMPKRTLNSYEINSIIKYLEQNEKISSQLLGQNGDFINIIIRPIINADFSELVLAVKDIIDPFQNDYDFHLGGQPYITGEVPKLIQKETKKLLILGLIIMSIILLMNLKNFLSVAMILSLIFLSLFSMLGFLGWIYFFTDSPHFFFSFINSSMPIVLLTIANSDGVHIMSRFFKEFRNSSNTKEAISKTMNHLYLPIFLTSITTGMAFFTMISSPIIPMTGYGISIGFGILWAWILSSTFLPAIINLKNWNFSNPNFIKLNSLEKITNVFGKIIKKYPRIVLCIGISIIIISSFGIRNINVEVNLINLFKSGNPIRESTLFLDEEMAGSMNLLLMINDDIKSPKTLNQMIEIQDYLKSFPTVNTTVSIADIIQEMHKTVMDNNPLYYSIPNSREKINNLFTMYSFSGDQDDFESLVNYDYEKGLITTMMHTVSTTDVIQMANNIEQYLHKNINDIEIEISGMMIFLKDFVSLVVESSIKGIIMSILIILSITWIFFRSWKLGILSIIPLTSAVILNFGLMGWFGVDLTHFTALLTSVIIGVGVDFAIHYIAEFNYYSKTILNSDEINSKVINNVGYPILLDVFSNMGFAALIFSSLIPLVHMGSLMIFAMISTSIGTLTILASIIELNKKKI